MKFVTVFFALIVAASANVEAVLSYVGLSPESSQYWHIVATSEYLIRYLLALGAFHGTNPNRPFLKYVFLALAITFFVDLIELQVNGDYDFNYLDAGIFAGGILYAFISRLIYVRYTQEAADIEPGRIYVLSRAPRTCVEWVGSLIPISKGRGSVLMYCDGWIYGPDHTTGIYRKRRGSHKGKIARPIGGDSKKFFKIWESDFEGLRWSIGRNCFWMEKKIVLLLGKP